MLAKSPAFHSSRGDHTGARIGANTAIFSVVQGTLLRPLPFPDAERLVRLYEAQDDSGARGTTLNLSERTARQWREHGRHIFEDVAFHDRRQRHDRAEHRASLRATFRPRASARIF
jgi:hypothetical protein